MSVISGGTWCAGAFRNRMQIDSPALVTTALNQWMGLAPDPLGRDYLVARAHITHGAYASAPSDSSKRAECQSQSAAVVWGTEYVYHWRIVIPPDWVNYGPSSYAVIAQAHDVNAPNVGRRPALAVEVVNNVLQWVLSNTADPLGTAVFSTPITPGQELEFTLRVLWADGTKVPAAQGVFDIYMGDQLVYRRAGQKNTWDDGTPTEPSPPYIKAGIYQPNSSDLWWIGRQLTCYHVATLIATADETPQSLRALVNADLAANSQRQVQVL